MDGFERFGDQGGCWGIFGNVSKSRDWISRYWKDFRGICNDIVDFEEFGRKLFF